MYQKAHLSLNFNFSTQPTTHGITDTGRWFPLLFPDLGSEQFSVPQYELLQTCKLFAFATHFFLLLTHETTFFLTCYNKHSITYIRVSHIDIIGILDQTTLCYGGLTRALWDFQQHPWLYPPNDITQDTANTVNQNVSSHCQKSSGRQDQASHLKTTGLH